MGVQHLEPQDLKRKGNQLGQLCHVRIFFMEDYQHLLSQIFGLCPRYT